MSSKPPPEIQEARFLGKRFRYHDTTNDYRATRGPFFCLYRRSGYPKARYFVYVQLDAPGEWDAPLTVRRLHGRKSLTKALVAAEAACRRFHAKLGKALGVEEER